MTSKVILEPYKSINNVNIIIFLSRAYITIEDRGSDLSGVLMRNPWVFKLLWAQLASAKKNKVF